MKPSAVYIHIPFCSHKCLFCSFAIAVSQTHRADEYIDRLENEMKSYPSATIDSLYLGGGTPSMLNEQQLERLMKIIRKRFSLSAACEITMEANPEGIDPSKAQFIKDLGINRLSLGVQSLDDRYLKFLGRKHTAAKAIETYHLLKGVGFQNTNLDLMYAFPAQTEQELEADVRAIASLGSEHLSLYTLTIEPNSRFFAAAIKLDEEEKIAQGYLRIISLLKEYGFYQYEVSNFAKNGFESRHNKNYWLGGRYIGLGMGAHGFISNRRYWNTAKLSQYLAQENIIEGFEDLNEETIITEKLIFGLRMNEGVDKSAVPLNKKDVVDRLIKEGFLSVKDNRILTTDQGRLVLDEISVQLV